MKILFVLIASAFVVSCASNSKITTERQPQQVGDIGSPLVASQPRSASKAERMLLCDAIEAMMEAQQIDAGLDHKDCLNKATVNTRMPHELTFTVEGNMKFNAPNKQKSTLNCSIAFVNQPVKGNIIQEAICKDAIPAPVIVKAKKASKAERALLCDAIEAMMEAQQVDAGLDRKYCLSKATVNSKMPHELTFTVEGKMKFNAPNKQKSTLNCSIAYVNQPVKNNLIQDAICN